MIQPQGAAFSFSTMSAILLLLLVLGGSALRLRQAGNTVDDAYITFRHARNLMEGRGLVYNPPDPVLGTSSPAYALLLAGLAGVSGSSDLPRLALWLNTFTDALLVLAMFTLMRRLGRDLGSTGQIAALAAAGLVALDAKIVDFSTGGMESSLFTGLLLAVALLVSCGRTEAAAVLAGCSVWVRPDGGLLVAAFLIGLWLSRRKIPIREGLLAALPVAVGATAVFMVYGDPLPASLRAKAARVYLLPADHALRYLCRHLA
ncbi:MAG: hypothetical protein ACE5ID_07290, partial [Acidobacteriota bacterium]